MEQPEKSAAKSESERDRAFRRVNERCVVQAELRDRCFQMLEVAGVDRINSAEHHRVNLLKTWQRLARRISLISNRIADFHVSGRFDVRDEIADGAGAKLRL